MKEIVRIKGQISHVFDFTISRSLPPQKPGPLTVTTTGEEMDTIIYDVNLPTLTDPDVETRQLSVSIDGGEPTVQTVGKEETKIVGLKAPQGSFVVLSLIDIDDGGNRSEASTFSFTATDTVPPSTPGVLGVEITGEE